MRLIRKSTMCDPYLVVERAIAVLVVAVEEPLELPLHAHEVEAHHGREELVVVDVAAPCT
jgi:hypothetical protein